MEPVDFAHAHIRAMHSYVPGLQINTPDVIKLNSNENPFPASAHVLRALQKALEENRLQLYPDPRASALRQRLAAEAKQETARCIVTNGSDEALSLLFRTVLGPGDRLVIARPTYSLYPILAQMQQAELIEIPLTESWNMDFPALLKASQSAKLCILANPNAPTGVVESRQALLDFAATNPGLTLVDEAYVAFGGESVADQAGTEAYPRLLTTNTFSKTHSLAGQRIGWMFADATLTEQFDKLRDSYNVSRLAQVAALAALEDADERQRRITEICSNRDRFARELEELGFSTLPSKANFVFTRPPESMRGGLIDALNTRKVAVEAGVATAKLILQLLRSEDILVRHFEAPPCTEYLRISIGHWPQMDRILRLLYSISRR